MKCPDANRVIFLIPTSQITFDLGEYIFCKCFLHNAVKVLLEDLMPMHKFFLLLLCLLLVINLTIMSGCVSPTNLHVLCVSASNPL